MHRLHRMSRSHGLALLLVGASVACVVTGCSDPIEAPADYLNAEYYSGSEPELRHLQGVPSARFGTPHLGIWQSRRLVTDDLDEETAEAVGLEEGQSFTAASGYEFLIAVLVGTDEGAGAEDGVTPSIALVAGAETLELTRLPSTYFDRLVVIASVPVGEPVTLQVDDAGQIVTWDLREADYAADPVSQRAAIYGGGHEEPRVGGVETTTGQVRLPASTDGLIPEQMGDLIVGLDLATATFRVSPYVIGLGWAPADTMWAEVFGFTVTYESELISVAPGILSVNEPAAAYSMTTADGQVYPLAAGNTALDTVQLPFDTPYVVFAVRFGFIGGTFTVAPQAPINGLGTSGNAQTASWTQIPPPLTLAVKIT